MEEKGRTVEREEGTAEGVEVFELEELSNEGEEDREEVEDDLREEVVIQPGPLPIPMRKNLRRTSFSASCCNASTDALLIARHDTHTPALITIVPPMTISAVGGISVCVRSDEKSF